MSVKHVLFVVLKFLLFYDSYALSEYGKECRTPRKTLGVCKPIQDCPIIVNVFKTNQLNEETKERIKQYSCEETFTGIPKMCCEKDAYPCKTPEQTAGICVTINRCPILASLLDQKPFLSSDVIQYLRASECSSPDNKARVCCPFVEKPIKLQTTHEPLEVDSILPEPGDCGIQEADLKIIGGTKVELGEFPWMALLEYGSIEKPVLACGGTLISSRFVLTAGHCLQGPAPTRYGGVKRIRLGEYNIRNETDCVWYFDNTDCALPILRIDVESVAVHENFVFNSLTREHDIAIIKMKQDAEYTDFVRPICLPSPKLQIPRQLDVAGWGSTEISDQSSDKLKVNVPLFDKTNCANMYQKLLRGLKLGKGQICAGGVIGKDSCTGDSGGPLMAGISNKFDKIWYQFGVISFGPSPCGKPHPAVYTLVTEYVPWIKTQISKLS